MTIEQVLQILVLVNAGLKATVHLRGLLIEDENGNIQVLPMLDQAEETTREIQRKLDAWRIE